MIGAYFESTEYGVARSTNTVAPRCAWLGTAQRSTDNLADITLMGARLYNPTTGRFLSVDPIAGGNANSYTYPTNPLNHEDLDGRQCHDCAGPSCDASCRRTWNNLKETFRAWKAAWRYIYNTLASLHRTSQKVWKWYYHSYLPWLFDRYDGALYYSFTFGVSVAGLAPWAAGLRGVFSLWKQAVSLARRRQPRMGVS
jgi:RHS repeat-associated protein